MAGYNASANSTVRSFISSYDRRAQNQLAMIERGFDPQTGQPLSPAEQQQTRREFMAESARATGENVLKFKDEAQKTLALLRTEIGKAQQAAAGVSLAGAQTEVEAGRTRVGGTEPL